ncbi:MAG: sulfur carrier protein ThiS [Propionibacteriales bacterium]|nr:sulfur carrier protein ThiS [Propionibacteriales bacterium]
MSITHNGEPMEVPTAATVADLLTRLFDDPRPHGIAVAVNGEVVPRGDWAGWRLADGDAVEVVTAVSGG